MPIGTGASFSLGVSPVNLGYLLPLVITLGSYKLSRQFVIVPLIFSTKFSNFVLPTFSTKFRFYVSFESV